MALSLVFLAGLIMGSFINVCIYRIPRKESLIAPPSHCPLCQNHIRWQDNVPILSFLLLRGRCRACRGAISWRYPVVELAHACGYLLLAYRFGLSLETLLYALFFSSLLVLTVIDLDHQILPDVITLPGIVLGFMAGSTVLPPGPINAALGLGLGGGLFYLMAVLSLVFLKKEGMGGGDIKLAAYIGALLGWQNVLLAVFCASLLGSAVGISLIATGARRRNDPIPFGPFLAMGGFIALLWGDAIYGWYLYV